MGAPAVIAVPSKSYVAINSYKSDRSLTSTMCDLGRVSNLAAAVILPRSRTSNFMNRNSATQSVRSLPHKKRPFTEVIEPSSSCQGNVSREMSTTNGAEGHKRRRVVISSQSSTSFIENPLVMEANINWNHDSNPQAKVMNLKSTNTIREANMETSPDMMSTVNFKKNHSVSNQGNTQLASQHNVKLQMSAMGQFPIQHPLAMQLQQQNHQLRNENMQLQKQLSLSRQLMKYPQRLNQVLTRLEQRAH